MSAQPEGTITLPPSHRFVWMSGARTHIARRGADGRVRTTLCGQDEAHARAWIIAHAYEMEAADVCHYCARRWLDRAAGEEPP